MGAFYRRGGTSNHRGRETPSELSFRGNGKNRIIDVGTSETKKNLKKIGENRNLERRRTIYSQK